MDRALRQRLESFLLPLYQGVDGVSRIDDLERIARIARQLHTPASDEDSRAFELLLLFHGLGKWLDKMGNLSRTLLAVGGLDEGELRRTAASIRRLEAPLSEAERAVAAAVLIEGAGVRGLTEQFARARREGNSTMDIVRGAVSDVFTPEWLSPRAAEWLHTRREARGEVCRRLTEELALDDLA